MRTEWVNVADGVDLAVDRWDAADGPASTAFVLVHGLASNARMWDGVAERLTAIGHQVATVDLRGHGRSSKVEDGYDVPTVADDLAAVLERTGLEHSIVVGQSWGGNVVVELAARHPASVRAIGGIDGGWIELSEAFPDWEACRAALAPPHLIGRPRAEVEGWIRMAHRDWPETGIRGTLANFEVRTDGTIAPWLSYEHHLLVLRGLWEHRPSERYAGLEVPVLLVPVADGVQPAEVVGAEDGTGADDGSRASVGPRDLTDAKRAAVEAAAAAIPRVRVRWFVGHHDVHAQQPAAVASVLHQMTLDGFAP